MPNHSRKAKVDEMTLAVAAIEAEAAKAAERKYMPTDEGGSLIAENRHLKWEQISDPLHYTSTSNINQCNI